MRQNEGTFLVCKGTSLCANRPFCGIKYNVKRAAVIISYILLFAVIFAAIFSFTFLSEGEKSEKNYGGILRLWNIDCFEGGKGSRTNFLKSVASAYEKANDGVYISVSSATLSGYTYALNNGGAPDMVSFGVGAEFSSLAAPLAVNGFCGGKIGDMQYALPWCRGGYVIYSFSDDFSSVSPENTVISCGGNNLPAIAAAIFGLSGKYKAENSTSAYVNFLNGKYKYLFGTQRDYSRFLTRGKEVFYKAVEGYNDLYQYISILNKNEGAYSECEKFIKFLLSENMQKKLSSIGMVSDSYNVYAKSDGVLFEMQNLSYSYTLGAFTGGGTVSELKTLSAEALAGGDTKNLKNYLKTVA